MAISQQSLKLTNAGGGSLAIAIGNESYTFDTSQIRQLFNGRRDLDLLLFQIIVRLVTQNVNPNNSTFAQMKTTVEGGTYWWGN